MMCYMSHYWIQALCRVPATLGKALNTLGKGFAECHTRQRPLEGKNGWQSSLCREPFVGQLLPSAETALGKENEPSQRRKR